MTGLKHWLGITRRTLFSGFAVVLTTLLLLGWWAIRRAEQEMRQDFLQHAQLAARAIELDLVKELAGTASDLSRPAYLRLKDQLSRMRTAYPTYRFLYLMGQHPDGTIFFYVDSEPEGSANESPAGQIYGEASASVLHAFAGRVEAVVGPETDRWGTLVTSMVPLIDPRTEQLIAVLGMDVDASTWTGDLVKKAAAPVGALLAVLCTISLFFVSRRAKLLAAEANQASVVKSRFLANMSHEIRTPLHGIIGLCQLERLRHGEVAVHAPYFLNKLEISSRHLLHLLNNILDLSKIESGKLELDESVFNLSKLLEQTIELHRSSSENKGLTLSLLCDPDTPEYVLGDPLRTTQIVSNLLSNAVKFTERGIVELATRRLEDRGGKIHLELMVKDTGIGMNEAHLARVFDLFEQADGSMARRFGGSGLGMSICRSLCELMGGDILVESALGLGTKVTVHLPFKPADSSAVSVAEKPEGMEAHSFLQKARILIADDVPMNREILFHMLKGLGCKEIIEAQNGREAVEAARTQRFDLILLDLQMPELDGFVAAVEIRKIDSQKDVPIVAVSANALQEERIQAIAAGMNDYLIKPYAASALMALLEKWISRTDVGGTLKFVRSVNQGVVFNENQNRFDQNFMLSLTYDFLAMYGESPENIRQYLAKSEQDKALKLLHAVKGVSLNLGLEQIAEAVVQLELSLMEGDSVGEDLMQPFAEAMQQLSDLLLNENQ